MLTTRRSVLAGGSLLTAASAFRNIDIAAAQPIEGGATPEAPTGPLETAIEAYVYGYPLVTTEMTRRVLTNVPKPEAGLHAPMGQFADAREYPTAAFKAVTAPNADTLYSSAWLDLSQGPWVLQVPDEHGRYYLMPMLDAWTDVFAAPGTRTTGTGAGEFAIVGPGWHGELPPGVEELRSNTNLIVIIGRTYCTGTPEDYAAVHAIQDQYKLVPLSAYGKAYTPPPGKVDPSIDMKTATREQVEGMDTVSFFKLVAELMKQNPPYAADAPILTRLAGIGLVPGRDFDSSKLASVPNIQDVPRLGVERIVAHFPHGGEDLNGWGQAGRKLRHQLHPASIDYPIWLGVQPRSGRCLSEHQDGQHGPEAGWRQQIRHALSAWPDAAGAWLLVTDNVRRGVVLRRQPAEPLYAQSAQCLQV